MREIWKRACLRESSREESGVTSVNLIFDRGVSAPQRSLLGSLKSILIHLIASFNVRSCKFAHMLFYQTETSSTSTPTPTSFPRTMRVGREYASTIFGKISPLLSFSICKVSAKAPAMLASFEQNHYDTATFQTRR